MNTFPVTAKYQLINMAKSNLASAIAHLTDPAVTGDPDVAWLEINLSALLERLIDLDNRARQEAIEEINEYRKD